jgi:hypothetical protein
MIIPGKAPFDYGLFFGAVQYLLGEPDRRVDAGFDGSYLWYYNLTTKKRSSEIRKAVESIRRFMTSFDLCYPESICEVAQWDDLGKDAEPVSLKIRIQHPVEKDD